MKNRRGRGFKLNFEGKEISIGYGQDGKGVKNGN